MGTETKRFEVLYMINLTSIVKLNNPLMGTETWNGVRYSSMYTSIPVKLNNPLMGTET